METMTVGKARKVLNDKGINWTSYMDLRNHLLQGHDIETKSAIERLCTFLTQGI